MWGAVFACPPEEKQVLDRIEGVGEGYDETIVPVELDDGSVLKVRTYTAHPSAIDEALLPQAWYHRYVTTGADEQGLPAEYVEALRRQPVVADGDGNGDGERRS